MSKFIALFILFAAAQNASGLMCVQLLDTEHVFTHHAPSAEIESLFTQISRSNASDEAKLARYSTVLRDLARSNTRLRIADLYYIQKVFLPLLPRLNSEQLVHTALFFSSRNFKVSQRFKISLEADFRENSASYSPKLMVLWLKFFSQSEIKPTSNLFSKLEEHFLSLRTSMTSPELTGFIFYYSKIYQNLGSLKITSAFQKAFIGIHNQFDPNSLGMIAESLAHLQIKPNKRFVRIFLKSVSAQMKMMNRYNLSRIGEFFASLQISMEPDFRKDLLEEISKDLNSFSTDGVVKMVYDFFLIGDFEAVHELISHPQFSISEHDLSSASSGILHLMNLYFEHVRSEEPPFKVSLDLSQAFISDNKSTNLEDKVEAGLKEQEVEYIKEHQVSSLNFVDFFVPSQNLIIQVDGPTHFIRMENGELRLRSNDLRFNELHEALGYRVLRIRYTDVD